jgi:acyl-CoA thioester hydrolase
MDNTYSVLISELHLDTFGHVNNAKYLELYEAARWELITQRGFGLKEIQETKTGPVILEVQMKFLKELTLRETIQITTKVLSYEGKISRLQQQMLKADGSVASEALLVVGFFDLEARKLIKPSPAWLKAIDWV